MKIKLKIIYCWWKIGTSYDEQNCNTTKREAASFTKTWNKLLKKKN